eukprot:TRINITY_DN36947_c0_g2_i3.p1 TRINITY_DN36947_c0_g2~~TRINITY_DN36947_c0_g2_i3.p1  ORF type:complete len:232 (+),score=52.62 TRINITY_DN36947_c0_g2_i3:134-829(+)
METAPGKRPPQAAADEDASWHDAGAPKTKKAKVQQPSAPTAPLPPGKKQASSPGHPQPPSTPPPPSMLSAASTAADDKKNGPARNEIPPVVAAKKLSIRLKKLEKTIENFREGEEYLQYSVTFPMHNCRLKALLEEGYFPQVEGSALAQVTVPPEHDDLTEPFESIGVALRGTLLSTYYAHLLITKRIKEMEAEEANADAERDKIKELQAALARERKAAASTRPRAVTTMS